MALPYLNKHTFTLVPESGKNWTKDMTLTQFVTDLSDDILLEPPGGRPPGTIEEESKDDNDDVVGLLKIKIIDADLKNCVGFYGKMDPYCELFIGNEMMLKTQTHTGGDNNPVWNQQEIEY